MMKVSFSTEEDAVPKRCDRAPGAQSVDVVVRGPLGQMATANESVATRQEDDGVLPLIHYTPQHPCQQQEYFFFFHSEKDKEVLE